MRIQRFITTLLLLIMPVLPVLHAYAEDTGSGGVSESGVTIPIYGSGSDSGIGGSTTFTGTLDSSGATNTIATSTGSEAPETGTGGESIVNTGSVNNSGSTVGTGSVGSGSIGQSQNAPIIPAKAPKWSHYIFLRDEKVATIETQSGASKTIIHLNDHLGGSNIDTDSSGEVVQITDYLPYGKERVMQRSSEYKNKYGFIGKEKDTESGLNYVEARYYDSGIGRFVSQDRVFWEMGQTKRGIEVLGDPQNMNAYGYARNNPVNFSDKSGEFSDLGYVSWSVEFTRDLAGQLPGVFKGLALAGGVVIVGALAIEDVIKINDYIKSAYGPKQEEQSQVASVASAGSPSPGGGDNGNKKKDEKKDGNQISTKKGNYELSDHAVDQMSKRGISNKDITNTITNNKAFEYKDLISKQIRTGFYDAKANIFVGIGEKITTVIKPKEGIKYIENLLKR